MNAEDFYELCRLIKVYEERRRKHISAIPATERAAKFHNERTAELDSTIKFLTQLKESVL